MARHRPAFHARNALNRTIAKRLIEARELAGLRLYDAAQYLGIPHKLLEKLENAHIPNPPPIVICNAAKLYDVSVDFIYGFSPDWERDETIRRQRTVNLFFYERYYQNLAGSIARSAAIENKISILGETVGDLPKALLDIDKAFQRFTARNPEFIDMPAGAPVLAAIQSAQKLALKCDSLMRRFITKKLNDEFEEERPPKIPCRKKNKPPKTGEIPLVNNSEESGNDD